MSESHRHSNVLDPVQPELPPHVWEHPAAPEPILKPVHAHWIASHIYEILDQNGYEKPQRWLRLYMTGSLCGYQYSDASDVDVSLFVDSTYFPEWSRAEMIGIMIKGTEGLVLPGTPYELQAYVVSKTLTPSDLYQPGLRAGYDIDNHRWVSPPDRALAHDVESQDNGAYVYALEVADKMHKLLEYEPQKAIMFWHQIHKKRSRDEMMGKGDTAESNLAYKMLFKKGLTPQIAEVSGEHIAQTDSDDAAWRWDDNRQAAEYGLHFRSYGDAVPGGYNGGFSARDPETGEYRGHIDYNSAANQAMIADIQVDPKYRRQGIGTKLFDYAQRYDPEMIWSHGMTTPEGEAWKQSLLKKQAAWTAPGDVSLTTQPAQVPMQQGPFSPYANVNQWQVNIGRPSLSYADPTEAMRNMMFENHPQTPFQIMEGEGGWEGKPEKSMALHIYDTPHHQMQDVMHTVGKHLPGEEMFGIIPHGYESTLWSNPYHKSKRGGVASRGTSGFGPLWGSEVIEPRFGSQPIAVRSDLPDGRFSPAPVAMSDVVAFAPFGKQKQPVSFGSSTHREAV